MILGMTPLTFIHVVLSLIGIATGLLVLLGMLKSERQETMTAIFLASTLATSLSGFLFPFTHLLPSQIVGVISIVILAIAIYARYVANLAGAWRWIYVALAALALYFNVLVLIVQAFQKVPVLAALAPTQSEPPFLIAQAFALLFFAVAGSLAALRFQPGRET